MTNDVGNFIVASVLHALHGMQYTALHWLKTVFQMRHRTLQDNIRGVVEKPVLIHATEVFHGRGIKSVHRHIV